MPQTPQAPEIALIQASAASSVTLSGTTAEILTSGASQGALEIASGSTYSDAFTASSGEYEVQTDCAAVLITVTHEGAVDSSGEEVTLNIVAGQSGDSAGGGVTLASKKLIAAADTTTTVRDTFQFLVPGLSAGQVITLQVVPSDSTDWDMVELQVCMQMIQYRQGYAI